MEGPSEYIVSHRGQYRCYEHNGHVFLHLKVTKSHGECSHPPSITGLSPHFTHPVSSFCPQCLHGIGIKSNAPMKSSLLGANCAFKELQVTSEGFWRKPANERKSLTFALGSRTSPFPQKGKWMLGLSEFSNRPKSKRAGENGYPC